MVVPERFLIFFNAKFIKKLFLYPNFKGHRYEECFNTTANYFKFTAFQTWAIGRMKAYLV